MLKLLNQGEELPLTAGLSVLPSGNLTLETINLGLWEADSLFNRIFSMQRNTMVVAGPFVLPGAILTTMCWCTGPVPYAVPAHNW